MTSPFKKVLPVDTDETKAKIAAVIPCFQVREYILDVLQDIGDEVSVIYVIDDACPENTGEYVKGKCRDSRVKVVQHKMNRGVGAATMTGYQHALNDKASIIVKIDGDGQMDPTNIPAIIKPLLAGEADYSKGNRFSRLHDLKGMPVLRLLGNSLLSFISKFSSGYWHILDPTNGFTAVQASVISVLPMEKISKRFFFESDMLFRLSLIGATAVDVPMESRYFGETSNLRLTKVGPEFFVKHLVNTVKRLTYVYLLRNFNIASIELILGGPLLCYGTAKGISLWKAASETMHAAPPATIMLSSLPIIIGTQLLLAFLAYDMQKRPNTPIHKQLGATSKTIR